MIIHIIGIIFVMGTSIGTGIYFIQRDNQQKHSTKQYTKQQQMRFTVIFTIS